MGGQITIAGPTGNTSTNVARVQLLQVVLAAGSRQEVAGGQGERGPLAQGDYEVFLEESVQSCTER